MEEIEQLRNDVKRLGNKVKKQSGELKQLQNDAARLSRVVEALKPAATMLGIPIPED